MGYPDNGYHPTQTKDLSGQKNDEDYLVICLTAQAHSYPGAVGIAVNSRAGAG